MSQLGHLTDRMRAHGVEPVAIAVTATFSQIAFSETLGVDFPMLSDWEGTVANAYGVQYDEWKGHTGLAKRSVFLIDGERRVRYRWHSDDALVVPDLYEALDEIEALAEDSEQRPRRSTAGD
ncbi:MAG TPA: redoxin domain-containing protein [Acidimicrobiia bacterium]|nr:redoxin domain-containing protein [Acidimicrobiia bacterium]